MNDINGIELKVGDIIELFQTVNGESKFVINSIDPIDISYECDTNRKYEYDMKIGRASCRERVSSPV